MGGHRWTFLCKTCTVPLKTSRHPLLFFLSVRSPFVCVYVCVLLFFLCVLIGCAEKKKENSRDTCKEKGGESGRGGKLPPFSCCEHTAVQYNTRMASHLHNALRQVFRILYPFNLRSVCLICINVAKQLAIEFRVFGSCLNWIITAIFTNHEASSSETDEKMNNSWTCAR